MQIAKFFLSPDLPHPAPKPGCRDRTPPGGKIFFQKPHICVFKMTSATFRSMYVGVPGTPARPPPGPPQGEGGVRIPT